MKPTAVLLATVLTSGPLSAEVFDDATCGAIFEYVTDLAYDQGAPVVLAPEGRSSSSAEGCVFTHVLMKSSGPAGVVVERITFGGEGLADWVAGQGWPAKAEVTFEGAYLWSDIPECPAMEWAARITSRRQAISGAVELSWDRTSGILSLELLEGGAAHNWVRVSALASGITEGPIANSLTTVRVHEVEADLSFDGMFETVILTPLAASLLVGEDDPAVGFAALIALVQSYIAVLPAPQVPVNTVLNLGAFMDTLPSPTGRLQITLHADSGVSLFSGVVLVAEMGAVTPDSVARFVKDLLGAGQLTVRWFLGKGE